jgi:hypothetical protein
MTFEERSEVNAIEDANNSVFQSLANGYNRAQATQFAHIAAMHRLGSGHNKIALEIAHDAVDARYA